jgi:hypothetical protein
MSVTKAGIGIFAKGHAEATSSGRRSKHEVARVKRLGITVAQWDVTTRLQDFFFRLDGGAFGLVKPRVVSKHIFEER